MTLPALKQTRPSERTGTGRKSGNVRAALVTYSLHCGGVETFLLRLAAGLSRRGLSVEVVTTEGRGKWFDLACASGVPCRDFADASRSPMLRSWNTMRRIIRGQYDVLLLNHVRLAQAALAMLPDRVAAIPILHNDLKEIYDVGCANRRAWNVLVGVSHKVAGEAQRLVGDRPIVPILNGVALPDPGKLANRRPFGGPLKLVYVGRLDPVQKRVLALPEIVARCLARNLDVTLCIAGDGAAKEELVRNCEKLARGRISFAGLVPPEEVYNLLLDSHVFLMPSRFEGLPIAPLEAQACGCVPVCSLLPGTTAAAVDNGRTGILAPPDDLNGYVDAIEALARGETLWRKMSAAGPRRVGELFSVERMCDQYEKLIFDCLSGNYALPVTRRLQLPIRPSLFSWRQHLGWN